MKVKTLTLKFDIYFRNEKTGRVEIVNNKLVRNDVYIKEHVIAKHLCPNSKTVESVLDILKDRVLCEQRCDETMLRLMGLKEYNVYDILRNTHGVDSDDYLWIKFDCEDITWDDVKVRD